MCEFCKDIKKASGEYTEFAGVENDLGVLGDMTTSIGVWSEEDGTFTLTASTNGALEGTDDADIKINYCPMCGRELCHSDNVE